MKRPVGLALAAWVALASACHSTQPQQRASSNVVIQLSTTGTAVGAFIDNKRVGGPDRPTTPQAQCDVAQVGGQDFLLPGSVLPWPLAVEITIYHDGVPSAIVGNTPVGDVIGRTDGFTAITGYDTSALPPVPAPDRPPDLQHQTYFTDGHFASSGSREWYERCTTAIPWPVPDPSIYGPVQILDQTRGSPTYSLSLQQGDTVVVKAQKQGDLDLLFRVGKSATLTGKIVVDGTAKVAAASTADSGSGLVMTFTLP